MSVKKNTKFSYFYRDADNYKSHHDLILEGTLSQAEKKAILDATDIGGGFIPGQIGLPELQDALQGYDMEDNINRAGQYDPFGPDGADHPWHEIENESFALETDEQPTFRLTAKQVLQAFIGACGKWDDVAATKRLSKKLQDN